MNEYVDPEPGAGGVAIAGAETVQAYDATGYVPAEVTLKLMGAPESPVIWLAPVPIWVVKGVIVPAVSASVAWLTPP